jgi:hypothetical protein
MTERSRVGPLSQITAWTAPSRPARVSRTGKVENENPHTAIRACACSGIARTWSTTATRSSSKRRLKWVSAWSRKLAPWLRKSNSTTV